MTASTVSGICRACNTEQQKAPSKGFVFRRHAGAGREVCPGSGKTRPQVETMLRTFDAWDNTDQVTRWTLIEDQADSVSLINTLSVKGTDVEVDVRLEPSDVLRLIDELGVIVRERGWRR